MKHISKCTLVGLIGLALFSPEKSNAELEVSASIQIRAATDFHAPLAAHGTWVEVGTYGRCWKPTHVAVGWQPYCVGRWVWTECGWYWASDEPWGWACYHYGTWYYDDDAGWVWIPGIEWAPAWVYWRLGGGYCGWAPIGPRGVVLVPRSYVFVEIRRFHEPIRRGSIVVNNTTIINKTTEVGGSKRESRTFDGASRQVVINEGPGLDTVQKAAGKSFKSVSIREAARHDPAPADAVKVINESRKAGHAPELEKQAAPSAPARSPGDARPPNNGRPKETPGESKPVDRLSPPNKQPGPPDHPQKSPNGGKRGKGDGHGKD